MQSFSFPDIYYKDSSNT